MTRHRRDIDDEFFGADEADRVREEREHRKAEAQRMMEENAKIDAIQNAAIEARRNELAQRGTEFFLIEGYRRHGVEPPMVNGDGIPTCSIDVLFSLDWTLGKNDINEPILVRPAHIGHSIQGVGEQYVRK
jgi:hypothetical protein